MLCCEFPRVPWRRSIVGYELTYAKFLPLGVCLHGPYADLRIGFASSNNMQLGR